MTTIILQRSNFIVALLLLLSMLAISAIYYSQLPLVIMLILCLFVIGYLYFLLRPARFNKIIYLDHNHCACYKPNGDAVMMRLDNESVFTRWFAIICLREIDGNKRMAWVTICGDAQWSSILSIAKAARCA